MTGFRLRAASFSFIFLAVCGHLSAAVLPPAASANFSPSTVEGSAQTKTTTYTLTISNPNSSDLTNIQFTGTYPAGLHADLIGNYTCGTSFLLNPAGNPGGTNGGNGSFIASGFTFTLNTLPAGDSCTVIFKAHGDPVVTTTLITDTTSTITSNEATPGAVANATLTVQPPILTSFSVVPLTSTVSSFNQDVLTVTPLDQQGNTLVGYTGTINFSCTGEANCADLVYSSATPLGGSQAFFPPNPLAGQAAGQTSYMYNVSPKLVGPFTVTVTDSVLTSASGTTPTIMCTPGAPAQFAVSVAATPTAGTPFNVTVTAVDLFGNTATSYTGGFGNVTLTSTDALATAGMPLPSALTNGTGTFPVTLQTAGSQTITATDTPNSVTGNTGSFTVTAAPSPTLAAAFGTSPISIGSSTSLTFTLTNPNSFAAQNVAFSDTLPSGLVVATPNGVTDACAGTITATAGGSSISISQFTLTANASCTFSVNVTGTILGGKTNTTGAITSAQGGTGSTATATLVVIPATTHLSVVATSPQTAGVAFSVTVTALNSGNTTSTGYTGTVNFTTSDNGTAVVVPANYTFTGGDNGVHTFSGVTLVTAGNQTVTATDTGTGTITGNTGAIAVNPAAVTHLSVTASSPQTAGTAFNVTVTGLDQFSNTATGYSGTVHFTSTDGAANLPGNATLTNGTGTSSATLNTAGNQTITATDTVTGSITGTTPTIVVNPGAATHFVVSAASPQTAGFAFNVTVTAKDAGNNTATGYPGTVHFTSSDGAAALPANSTLANGTGTFSATLNTAAPETITATDTVTASITGASGNITVNAPASFVVSNTADSGLGSLRAAINNANASPSPAAITFPGVTGKITLLSALPALTQSVTITGPGASTLAIDGSNTVQVFYVTSGVTATISGLTIQHGLDNGNTTGGGGIRNDGALTLSSCVVTGNSQTNSGLGGGIFNNTGATLTMNGCTISGNTAGGNGGLGGGLANNGTATVSNSTFSGNTATGGLVTGGEGGAIYTALSSNLTITGSTIAGNTATDPQNTATSGGGGIFSVGATVTKNSTISGNNQTGTAGGSGGGVVQFAGAGSSVSVNNTIIAANTDVAGNLDVVGAFTTTGGNNLIGVATGAFTGLTNGSNGNQVGTAATPINPRLSALANNGGSTQTILPGGNSPALGAANTTGFLVTDTDQRGTGFLRLANSVMDIGAVQLQGVALAATAGTPQSATISTTFGTNLAATATESCASCTSPVQGVTVTFTVPGSGASGTFAGGVNTAITSASGLATAVVLTANATAGGPYNVSAGATTPDQATAASASFSLTNAQATQTITGFNPIGAQTYGAIFLISGVTATSTLGVTFTSTTLGVCTVSGNAVTVIAGTGTCSITASQPGNASYSAAPTVTQMFSTNKAPLTVTVSSTSKAYGAALPVYTTSSVTGLTNGDTVGGTISISFSGTATTASPVGGGSGAGGAYPITAIVGGTAIGNYALTNNPGLLTINAVGLTVAIASQTKAYGAALPTLTGAVTGLVNGDTVGGAITVSYSTTATASSSVGGGTGAGGAYPITALVGGSAIGNYTLTNTPNLLTVTQVALTVTVAAQSKVYGAALPTLTGTVTGLVNGDVVGGAVTVGYSTTGLATSAIGTYPITALVGGSAIGNYALTNTPNLLTITKAALTVTANSISILVGNTLPALTASITGLVNGDTLGVLDGAPALATSATSSSAPGSYPITVAIGSLVAANYTFTLVNGTVTVIQPAPQPAIIAVVSGNGQSSPPGTAFAVPLVAIVTSALGVPVSNVQVSFTLTSGSTTFSSQNLYTGTDGTVRITVTPTAAGQITISAATNNAEIPAAIFNESGAIPSAPAQLSVLPSAITLNVIQGGDDPLPTSIAVTNTGPGTLQWTASNSGNPSWLALSATSGATPAATIASIITAGLAPGTYKSTITVVSGGQQQTVAVTLAVVTAVPAQFSLTPAALTVSALTGAGPIARVINVGNGGTGTLPWTVSAGSGATWLAVSPSSGNSTSGAAQSTVAVAINPAGLPAGQYLGNLAFTSPGVPPANVPVVLNLSALPNLISLVPSLQFRGAAGSALAAQSLLVTTNTGAGVPFTATAIQPTSANWLTITGASGGTPTTVSVSANTTGLAPGNYIGYVSVQSPGAGNTLLVPVVLDLGNPVALGTFSASPGGLLLSGPASASPGSPLTRSISLSSDSGAFSWTATALAGSGGSWLTVSPTSGSGNGSSTVSANLAGLQPGSYSGQVAIGASGTSNTELIVPVTLIVSSGTTPVTSSNSLQPLLPAGDFVASVDVPVGLQASLLSQTGLPVTGATVQVTFTTGDPAVTLTDIGGGNYSGVWSPLQTGPVSLVFTAANTPSGVVTGVVSSTSAQQPAFTAAGVVDSASFVSGAALGIGSISTVFGQNLSAQTATSTLYPLPLSLGGATVTINGVPAPLFYASSGQLNFFVPYELAGQTTATIVVSTANGVAVITGVPIAPESPGIYIEDPAGDAAAVHLTGQLVSVLNPATALETLEIFATGLGPVSNAPTDTTAAPSFPLASDQTPPVVTIGGVIATVSYAGLAPGFTGLYQLNVVVPAGLVPGPNALTISAGPLFGNTAILQVH